MFAVLLLRCLRLLAADTAARLGAALGVVAWRMGVRRRLVNETITRTLGVRGPARAVISRRSYATMGANFIDIWTAGGIDGIERHVELANPLWSRRLQADNTGLVMTTLHGGSWDAAMAGASRLFGSLLVYAKAQHHEAVDAELNRRRADCGGTVLLARNGDRTSAVSVVRALRSGGVVGLLADQRPRREEGAPAAFLGQPTYCHPGPVFFARRTGAAMVPGLALRVRAGVSRLYILRPLAIDGLDDAAATQLAMDALSALIAAVPGQYFWHHRRFTDLPEHCPAADGRWALGVDFLRKIAEK